MRNNVFAVAPVSGDAVGWDLLAVCFADAGQLAVLRRMWALLPMGDLEAEQSAGVEVWNLSAVVSLDGVRCCLLSRSVIDPSGTLYLDLLLQNNPGSVVAMINRTCVCDREFEVDVMELQAGGTLTVTGLSGAWAVVDLKLPWEEMA